MDKILFRSYAVDPVDNTYNLINWYFTMFSYIHT